MKILQFFHPYWNGSKFLLPRFFACLICGLPVLLLIIYALMPLWEFIDSHPLYSWLCLGALLSVVGGIWLVKRLSK